MLELCTGSRLHFGLMELAAGQPHRFGGLGLMLAAPQVCVRVAPRTAASHASRESELDCRVASALAQVERAVGQTFPHAWSIDATECPQLHSGLGLGTQLAAAVATAAELAMSHATPDGLTQGTVTGWRGVAPITGRCDTQPIRRLAALSGRGKRSAIGLHGFLYGGLVQDLGYDAPRGRSEPADEPPLIGSEVPRPIATRSTAFPEAWPVVLILAPQGCDVQGAAEEQLIQSAAAAPNTQRQKMLELSQACMSAVAECNFVRFAEAIEGYMKIAARLFASVQAGRYRDAVIAQRAEFAVRAGLRGVGQSSWGPTVFGFANNGPEAEQAADRLRDQLSEQIVRVVVTTAANHGARWRSTFSGAQHAG